jgi:hypothetical protein
MNDMGGGFDVGDLPARSATIPERPGALVPSPAAVLDAARMALAEIEQRRGMQAVTGYGAECREAVWLAAYGAAADTASQIVRDAHPEGPWTANNPEPKNHTVHVIHSGPGSGKSTAAKAFMVGLTRITEPSKFPVGSAMLVHHVKTAQAAYEELSALLPNTVALWTTENDANNPAGKEPRFSVGDLERHAVIVVTQEFFKGVRGDAARCYKRKGLALPRMVTFVDEKFSEVEVYDVRASWIESVLEHIQDDDSAPADLRRCLPRLVSFVQSKKLGDCNLETPAADRRSWKLAAEMQWFRTADAGHYARSRQSWLRSRGADAEADKVEKVFCFARCMAMNTAFVARENKGLNASHFVGYENTLPQHPGMVLLDATADIDHVKDLCPWRKPVNVPKEHYANLEIVHVPSIASGSLKRWLQSAQNRIDYTKHIQQTVLDHVRPGQKALIVCKKDVVVPHTPIVGWSEHVAQFISKRATEDTEGFPWEYQGRHLGVTWWGGYGIGANDWQQADVVLLFESFHLPNRTIIGITQGLLGREATQPPLVDMLDTLCKSDTVEKIKTGHLLRWLKQLALRGKARHFTDTGQCGTQKLVVTGDWLFLAEHCPRILGGSRLSSLDRAKSHLALLYEVLSRSDLPPRLHVREVGELMGIDWQKSGKHITHHRRFEALIDTAGWSFEKGTGRKGSWFVRKDTGLTPEEPVSTTEPTEPKNTTELGKMRRTSISNTGPPPYFGQPLRGASLRG